MAAQLDDKCVTLSLSNTVFEEQSEIELWQATFEDELVGEAIAKRHSTTGEAVDIGQRAGAYRTILTHFSQRYAKLPVIDDSFQVNA